MKRVGKKREVVAGRVQFWISPECAKRLRVVAAGFRVDPEVLAKSLFTAALECYLPAVQSKKVLVAMDAKRTKGITDVGSIVAGMRVGKR